MMKVTSIGKRILLTGMVVGAMITATTSSMVGAQAASTDDDMELMGYVETMPEGGTVGSWVIGGETFEADENTEFDTEEGPLEVDACAEVEYEATADGNLALEIEGSDSPGCVDTEDEEDSDNSEDDDSEDDEGEEVYGIVDVMPTGADAPIGTWVIDGVNYVATADTEIEEEHGPLTVGARVEIEFQVVDGVNQLMELETEPAPGEGPNTTAGMIESKGGAIVAASVTASTGANSTWIIGGTEYTIVSITEQQGALNVGSLAEVNSYTDTVTGREIATRISSMEMPVHTEFMFLPLVLQRS